MTIIREFPFEFRDDGGDGGDGLTLEGYAAVFNSRTEINSWEGTFTESIARGAFKRSINASHPVLMFNHGKHPLVGDMPIGAFTTIREDERGLFVRARLADNWLVQPVRDAIQNRSITGMSFRFEPVRDKWNNDKTERTLLELRVPELGPVVFPAYTDTEVSVRAREAVRLLSEPDVKQDLATLLMRDAAEIQALVDEPVREDTSSDDPPETEQDTPASPPASTRREQLDALARLKGIIE